MKLLNLKLVIILDYQNIEIFLQKTMFQIGLKKFFRLKKVKILVFGYMLLATLKTKKLLEHFSKKKKEKKKDWKSSKKLEIKNMLNGNNMLIYLIVGLIKKNIFLNQNL